MSLRVRDVRLFDPGSGIDAPGRDVLIEDGRIASLNARGARAEHTFEGRGRLLVPGFIDLRADVGEPGHSDRETVATATRAAASGGFTTIVAMPTSEPTTDRVEVVQAIDALARAAGPTRVLPAGAFSVGRAGERLAEFAKLAAAGCPFFTDADRPVADSQLLRYGLETADDVGTLIVTHAEDLGLSAGGVMNEGEVSTRLGLVGIPGTAEDVGVARDLAIAELTNARIHIGHVTTAGAVELIRQAKRRGVRVSAEASPHHLLLTDREALGYRSQAKLMPPLRTAADVEALIDGLADGTLDAIASDHRPRTALEKNKEFDNAADGAVALELSAGVAFELARRGRLTMGRALALLTRGPANVLGREDLGRLTEGGPADLVLFDPERVWTVRASELLSRAQCTPLDGWSLCGRSMLTVAGGTPTFIDPEENH